MRAPRAQHRPTIQNKPLPKRRLAAKAVRTAATSLSLAKPPRRRRAAQTTQHQRRSAPEVKPNGMSVFGSLSLAGALLALVFVTALHWQRQAYQVGQQEVELRSQIDLSVNEQRQLQAERNKARSPRESSERSRTLGLSQLQLDVDKAKPMAKNAKPRPGAPGVLRSAAPMGR